MKNLYIYCEGATEESFINRVLYPYLFNSKICAKPIICTTKRTKTEKFKGGVREYEKIKRELTILCKQHKTEMVTTMFDYYGLPGNTSACNDTSEHINDSTDTAPSKRLEKLIPCYAKVSDGTIVSAHIGIDTIVKECKHFSEWISKIQKLAI